jgi:hypothetical protein
MPSEQKPCVAVPCAVVLRDNATTWRVMTRFAFGAERAAEAGAFVIYRAALDREETAARNLQLHMSASAARR